MSDTFFAVVYSPFDPSSPVSLPTGVKVVETYRDKFLVSVNVASLAELRSQGLRVMDLREKARLRIADWQVDPAKPADRLRVGKNVRDLPNGDRYILQFIGPVKPEWLQSLASLGVEFLRYYPDYAYLVRASTAAAASAASSAVVRGLIPFAPHFKKSIEARMLMEDEEVAGKPVELVVSIDSSDGGEVSLRNRLAALGGQVVAVDRSTGGYQMLKVKVSSSAIDDIADVPSVFSVDVAHTFEDEDELACQVVAGNLGPGGRPSPGYLEWLAENEIDGSGVTIGIAEAGLDCEHPAFTGRITGLPGIGEGSHGTMVASLAAGRYTTAMQPDAPMSIVDPEGFYYAVGVAPGACLLAIPRREFPYNRVAVDCVRSYGVNQIVGSILNLSAGYYSGTAAAYYGACEAEWDRVVRSADPDAAEPVPLICCFSAGNKGPLGLTRPKSAKNPIVVGDSTNRSLKTPALGPDTVSASSSIGNCADGRVRPDIVAPGSLSSGAGSPQQPEASHRISHWLGYGDGTSAASPKVAGACALLVQWIRQRLPPGASPPSPALVKALLINGATDLGAGGNIPNMVQGWGRVNLRQIIDSPQPILVLDQATALRPESDAFEFSVVPEDPLAPLKVTLVWTDLPGPEAGSGRSLVNSLALEVVADDGMTWFGNNFVNGWSRPGGRQDAIQDRFPGDIVNNVQNVFLAKADGTYKVRVLPVDIVGDCLEPRSPYSRPADFRQDFAIVVRNAVKVNGVDAIRRL